MKVLLIEPPKSSVSIGGEDVFIFEPLALEYLGAGVASDHDVRILDMRLEKDLQSVLEGFQPDVVGITSYTVHVNTVHNLCDGIKKWNPEVLTVVGGHHATVMPNDFDSPSVDVVVIGEGVFTFRELVNRFEQRRSFDGIAGVAFRKNDNYVRSDPVPVADLDVFPFPDRSLTAKYRSQYYSEWMKPLASIRTSKGCPHRCNFCALWKIAGGRYLKREPEKIVEELAGIAEPFVFFADDESLVDVPRMKTLARLIKERGIEKQYFLYGRSDTIAKNPELLELWKDIGLSRVFVGLESFKDEDLEYVKKRSTVSDNDKAVAILHDLGIQLYASFILRPEFRKDDFAALRRYCRKLQLNFASFAVLTPLPGTDLYEDVKDQLLTHDYDFFDFIHTVMPTQLPLKEFYEEYCRLYKKAISPRKGLAFLAQYPWKEIPSILAKTMWWYKRLTMTYLDYENTGGAPSLNNKA